MSSKVEELLRQMININQRPNSAGWFSALCKVCNDHGRKGKRAGFKFSDEGGVSYHCFNCSHACSYEPGYPVSPDFQTMLDAFGVDAVDWAKATFGFWTTSNRPKKKQAPPEIVPINIDLPTDFEPIMESPSVWATVGKEYLLSRSIDPSSYPFYVCNRERWKKRIIIPYYKDGKLIYFQGRDMSGSDPKRYESPTLPKDRVMYGYDFLFKDDDLPLFVMEGWFDAFPIDGVALLGKECTPAHIQWLNMSKRQKIVVPDKTGRGRKLANIALSLGWKVSLPDIGSCSDINESIVRYGKPFVISELMANIKTGLDAQVNIRLYCK